MLITLSQALLNHLGIRITSFLIDISGYLIMAVTIVLVASLLYYAPGHDFSRLFTFTNFSGELGGKVWPVEPNLLILFLLGLQLPAYTITGFDASAHTAEETRGASVAVPKAIVFAVISSSVFGWIMLSCIVMAIPDLREGIGQGENVFFFTMGKVLPQALCALLYLGCGVAQYLCGLATVTSSSRMVYAFARDGGLPLSSHLRQVSARYLTPVKAIWAVAILSVGFASFSKVYSTIAVVCTIFLYISYVLPITLGLFAYKRSWTKMGPWDLGGFFRVAATMAVMGCSGLIVIGVQPPNELALYLILGFLVITGFIWQAFEKRRFQGPPVVGMELS